MRHVDFDLAAAERQIREFIKKQHEKAAEHAVDDDGRELVRVQGGLHDMVVAATLWGLRCRGEQVNPAISAKALGTMIGGVICTFADNMTDIDSAIDDVLDAIEDTFAVFSGENDGYGSVTGDIKIPSRPVGSA